MRTSFVEVRSSRLLKNPLRLYGEYRRPGNDTLVRAVQAPYAETTTIRGDQATIVRSIKQRLYTLDEDATVITGHGPDTRLGDEMRENPFVRA